MKYISNRVIRRYMSVFVDHARQSHNAYTPLSNPVFDALRSRRDFISVVLLLKARGLLKVTPDYSGFPFGVSVTDAGMRFFEDSHDIASERRWTRGLAITAIIISIAALCVSLLSLWLQYRPR